MTELRDWIAFDKLSAAERERPTEAPTQGLDATVDEIGRAMGVVKRA